MKIIIVDNYDSFTYNLYQYVSELTGYEPTVFSNDQLTWKQFTTINPDAVIISPGPGDPRKKKDFGICKEIILRAKMPVFGVCLGHQGIGVLFGAQIKQVTEIVHGRTSKIFHTGRDLFHKIPQGFDAVRYHSLAIDNVSFPKTLIKTAWTADGIVMGLKHSQRSLYGVQFHPESIGTVYGKKILENFLMKAV